MNQYARAFERAGLWPDGYTDPVPLPVVAGADCLPTLCELWRRAAAQDSTDRTRDVAARLEHLSLSGAALTVGIPESNPNSVANWIGERIGFWPDGIPTQRRVGLLSSHLGRGLDLRTAWFTALRAVCTKLNAADDLLVTTTSVTVDRFVRRCHELFGIRLLDVQLSENANHTSDQWAKSILQASLPSASPGITRLHLSSDFNAAPTTVEPIADRTVIALSQRLYVLSLKPHGRLLPLIQRRLEEPNWPVATVTLALGTDLVQKAVAEPLLNDGAVGWVLLNTLPISSRSDDAQTTIQNSVAATAPIIPVPTAERWSFLTHCTRRADGPWPGQAEEQFLDDLILDREASNHSALSSILRMLGTGRIAASSSAVRGSTPVVSFTSVPLAEIPRMRVFRAHRSRWDFEPYGICIRRDWLEDCGAKPVAYADDQTWAELEEDERPFFQVAATLAVDGSIRIDWSQEQEWRHVGDVVLGDIPADAALVFVPTEQEAAVVAAQSPWPIVVLSRHNVG